MEWEYKLHHQPLMTKLPLTGKGGLKNYEENIKKSEKEINNIAKEGWELFSSHVTAFNMLVYIFRRSKN
ncbi:hypothetical protein GOV12_02345 [Candidatus Pacearchaeota archaeon]|nr:hypothetical protein [Candidatus Pacearchaeota archaeon]